MVNQVICYVVGYILHLTKWDGGVYLTGKVVMEVLQLVRVGVLFVLAASVTWGFGGGTPCFTVSVNGPKCCNFLYFPFLFPLFLYCLY